MSRNFRTFQLANVLTILALFFASPASAQVATGTPPFGSFSGGPDIINLGNNNVHLMMSFFHKAGRGTNFTYDMGYDSSIWTPIVSGSTRSWQPAQSWGFLGQTQIVTGYISTQSTTDICGDSGVTTNTSYTYVDAFGIIHNTDATSTSTFNCTGNGDHSFTFSPGGASDGSGFNLVYVNSHVTVVRKDGTTFIPPTNSGSGTGSFTDRNGNQVTTDGSGHFFDTLSSITPVLTVAGTAPANATFTYTAPSGASASYTMKYATYTVKTNFGCSNITEYPATSTNLVSEIDLPDGSKYSFTYEQTPGYPADVTGRLAKVTLPTGGYISYTYTAGNLTGSVVGSNDPIVCADGSAAGLQRAVNDGTNTNTWTYARNQISGSEWTTTVSDPTTPTANQTLIYFQKDSASSIANNFYETQRQVYQGSTSGALLRQRMTCYNGNGTPSTCATTAVSSPITKRYITDQYGSSGLQCEHNYFYNSVGGLSEQDDYDYGSGTYGALLRKTLITYASLPPNITAFQQIVTIW